MYNNTLPAAGCHKSFCVKLYRAKNVAHKNQIKIKLLIVCELTGNHKLLLLSKESLKTHDFAV